MTNIDKHVKEVINKGELKGSDKECSYFPCHYDKQDCTWCFCPFYPCKDYRTGGRFTIGRLSGRLVWSCEGCLWIHKHEVANLILEKIKLIKDEQVTCEKLHTILQEVLRVFPP